jgi:hypothetical protein
MKKPLAILAILIFIILGLFLTRTAISNRISTSGVELGRTQDEIKKYQTENYLLREQIFAMSSLTKISSAAAEIGFVESKDTFAVSAGRPIARR